MPKYISKADALAVARYGRNVVEGIEQLPAVAVPEWISVEERLPEVGQRVLVYCRSQMDKAHITVSAYTADYSYTRGCYWSRRVKSVTHWMPLPEPPKEVQRGEV